MNYYNIETEGPGPGYILLSSSCLLIYYQMCVRLCINFIIMLSEDCHGGHWHLGRDMLSIPRL